jgi:Beta-galactosidase
MHRRAFHKFAGLVSLDLLLGRRSRAADPQASSPKIPNRSGSGVWDSYWIGAAYYPGWWPAEEWEIDFRQMRDLGINTVRMGEFAWALFEPAPGKFDFDWMDRAEAARVLADLADSKGVTRSRFPPHLAGVRWASGRSS